MWTHLHLCAGKNSNRRQTAADEPEIVCLTYMTPFWKRSYHSCMMSTLALFRCSLHRKVILWFWDHQGIKGNIYKYLRANSWPASGIDEACPSHYEIDPPLRGLISSHCFKYSPWKESSLILQCPYCFFYVGVQICCMPMDSFVKRNQHNI